MSTFRRALYDVLNMVFEHAHSVRWCWVSHLSHHPLRPSCRHQFASFCHSTLTQYLVLGIRSYFVINKTYYKLSCACVVSGATTGAPLAPTVISSTTTHVSYALLLIFCVLRAVYIFINQESERRKVLIFFLLRRFYHGCRCRRRPRHRRIVLFAVAATLLVAATVCFSHLNGV